MLFNYTLLPYCKKVGYISDVLYNYVRHDNSTTKNSEYIELIVPTYYDIYNDIFNDIKKRKMTNIEYLKPILFLKMMTMATSHLKIKTNLDYELMEKCFDDFFGNNEKIPKFIDDKLEKSINFYNEITNAKIYTLDEYKDFFDSIALRNGAIVKRQIRFSQNLARN